MKIIIKSFFLLVLFGVMPSAAQETRPFHAVEKLFAAMSAYDYAAMHDAATDDFQLLENGEIWDMARLVDAVRDAEGEIARRNFFAIIKQGEKEGSVWISYWNRADFRDTNGEEGSVAWLESVVVVRDGSEWKLEMMHSTGIKGAENLPEGLEMQEYVGANPFLISD